MNRDRGTIKWNALMLPEHVKLLREWKQEDEEVKMPNLSEWELEDIQNEIMWAYDNKYRIIITYWSNKKLHVFEDRIIRIKSHERQLYFENHKALSMDCLVKVVKS